MTNSLHDLLTLLCFLVCSFIWLRCEIASVLQWKRTFTHMIALNQGVLLV
jgi:hypothetical protein